LLRRFPGCTIDIAREKELAADLTRDLRKIKREQQYLQRYCRTRPGLMGHLQFMSQLDPETEFQKAKREAECRRLMRDAYDPLLWTKFYKSEVWLSSGQYGEPLWKPRRKKMLKK